MAIKGLSYMVAGKYAYSNSAISYSEGKVLGKAVSYALNLDAPAANNLYGDNEIAESDNALFSSGTLDLNATDFTETVRAWMYGITARTEGTGTTTTFYDYDDDADPIEMGVGLIELHQIDNTDKWQPVILTRVKPQYINAQAQTKGETIDWQTPTVTCTVMRAEDSKHRWMTRGDMYATEDAAKAVLNSIFGISVGGGGTT